MCRREVKVTKVGRKDVKGGGRLPLVSSMRNTAAEGLRLIRPPI